MKKSIVSRTIKTALSSLLAIIVSQELSLEFAAAAGIIAILNVFDTRKATIEGGLKRTLSAIIALLIGGFLFEKLGYKTWVFGLYLLLFVPVSFLLRIELGLGPSSVIVTHLLAFRSLDQFVDISIYINNKLNKEKGRRWLYVWRKEWGADFQGKARGSCGEFWQG